MVRNVPNLVQYRDALLDRGPWLAHLPPSAQQALEHPESQYMFGWSHGRELMNGRPDYSKGSFYANPVQDIPTSPNPQYPEYYSANRWPMETDLPGFRGSFRSLCQLIIQVGLLVAKHCDRYVASQLPGYSPAFLQNLISNSDTIKARLLHYFPKDGGDPVAAASSEADIDSWCGWHLDHSCLTGLTAAKYVNTAALERGDVVWPTVDDSAETWVLPEVACPDPTAGLYIKNRAGEVVQVRIPADVLAFQTGEALEITSANFLRATPHCVRGASTTATPVGDDQVAPRVARNTLAVFIQPAIDDELAEGYTFGQFTHDVLKKHYS
ncbi:hypothetical protein IWQ60_012336 [Tieghemiomyces parasiticus]|uniref:Non-haem dioxygenase N-terminal domain-containing protein n=1 Tax=Tieghemiomyces parasiticus TaxID=78921 RepID=A0A9W7ZI40_9FUNG|nr:hypothetical protein IWQ60_012336 [Tieghemiomyces parasiticus]